MDAGAVSNGWRAGGRALSAVWDAAWSAAEAVAGARARSFQVRFAAWAGGRPRLRVRLDPAAALLLAPFAMALGAAAYIAAPQEPSPWPAPMAAAGLALAAVGLRRRFAAPHAAVAAVLAALFAFGFALTDHRADAVAAPRVSDARRAVEVAGWVDRVDVSSTGRTRYWIRVARIDGASVGVPERVRVSAGRDAARPGARIRVRAVLQPPRPPPAPGAYDFARRAHFVRLGGVGFAVSAMEPAPDVAIRGRARLDAALARFRGAMAERLARAGGGEGGAVIAALATGDRSRISPEVSETLRAAGLGHILAISGLHMALVGGGAFFLLSWLVAAIEPVARRINSRKVAAVGAIAVSFAYLVISGGSTPTQRAFVMAAVAFGAILADRRALTQRGVALAALVVLCLAPESAVSPGFQMSFAAAAVLVAVNDARRRARRRIPATPGLGLFAGARRFLGGLSMTSLVAGAATAPFAAYHFNRIAALGFGANLVAMPVFTLAVMPLTALAGLLAPLGLEGAPAALAARAMEVVIAIAERAQAAPGAIAPAPAAPGIALALIAAGLVALAVLRQGRWSVVTPLVVAGALAWRSGPTPDLWIGAGGGWAARVEDGGTRVWTGEIGRGDRYGAELFMRRAGVAEPDARVLGLNRDAGRGFVCDASGCAGAIEGRRVAIARTWASVAEDCRRAAVVLTPGPAPPRVRAACARSLLIARRGRRDSGGVLDIAARGVTWRAETASDRPWRRGLSP